MLWILLLNGNVSGQTLIYQEDFGATNPTGWTVLNAGAGNAWSLTNNTSPFGTGYHMSYLFNSANAANTWAFTMGITMTAGNTYQVKFYQSVAGNTFPEKLKVTVGNAQTVASQTTTLFDNNNLTNTTYVQQTTSSYTCPANGVYYFAFQCYSAKDMFRLNVDLVEVYETVTCTAPIVYSVTGGGSFCSGGSGVAVGLSGSQIGVSYQLKKDGVNDGSPVTGTGSALSFGNKTVGGTYTVQTTTANAYCATNMTGSAVVTVNTLSTAPTSISGPAGVLMGSSNTYSVVGGSLGTGAVWNWYSGSCGGTLIGTGNSISPVVSGTTTYYVSAAGTCNTTACTQITVTVENVCDVVYVDAVNGNDTYIGGASSPVKTLDKAMTMVGVSRNHIKMTSGIYNESSIANLQNDLVIEGRYTNSSGVWTKSSNTASSTAITFSGTETINADVAHVMGFKSDAKNNWKLIDLNITTAAATGQTSVGNGKSNYGVWISGSSNYEISRCIITSGNATDGLGRNNSTGFDGSNGSNGNVGVTGPGGKSSCGSDAATPGGNGGTGGTGGSNATKIGSGSGASGSTGGKGGTGKDDDGYGGTAGSGATGTCSGGGGALGLDDSGDNNTPYGGNGASCTTVGAVGTNGSTVSATYSLGYFIPSYGSNGTSGGGGGGGAGGGGGGEDYGGFWTCDSGGGGGSGGSGGGGGGGAGAGARGGGSSFGIFVWNGGSNGVINNSSVSNSSAGNGATGGNGGNGGTGGAQSAQGANASDNQSNLGGRGGAGSAGGKGGNGGNANAGVAYAIAHQGGTAPSLVAISPAITINTSTSGGSVPNTPVVSLNAVPSKICQNSVLNVTTSAASWTLPGDWSFVKYNNTGVASEYTSSNATADITTSGTSGFYDLTANGLVFKSYLNVRSSRTLPVITVNPSPPCAGNTIGLSATSWGTEVEYKWEIFDATNAPNKGLTTNLVASYNTAAPTTTALTAGAGVSKTYLIRYQVREACCGWSIPVFETITVNPSLPVSVSIAASPSTAICLGTNVTFTATPVNGGVTPTYQWKLNGANVGTNAATYVNNTLANGDAVTCVMTSNETACISGSPATSNTVDITAPVAVASVAGNATATCIVNGNSWVHFMDSDGKIIVSINPGGNNLGSVTATSFEHGASVITQACGTGSDPAWTTAALGRSWKIVPEFNLGAEIRFPLKDGELSDLVLASATTLSNPRDNVYSRSDLKMSRFHDGNLANGNQEDSDWANNCMDGGTVLNPTQTTSGNITATYFPVNIAASQFVQFSTPGFSEFWLHNSQDPSALPVQLTNLSITCNLQHKVDIYWSTASEQNSQRFIVEKSRDLHQWVFVAEKEAAGNSAYNIDYVAQDADPYGGISYYRLVQQDLNGTSTVYSPLSTTCFGQENSMIVFPNPTQGNFTVEISSTQNIGEGQLVLTDMTGKLISSRPLHILEGKNQVLFEDMELRKGTYMIRLVSQGNEFNPLKVVVN